MNKDTADGKTAFINGLAWRIVNGDVSEGLKHKRLVQLDMGAPAQPRAAMMPFTVPTPSDGVSSANYRACWRSHPGQFLEISRSACRWVCIVTLMRLQVIIFKLKE